MTVTPSTPRPPDALPDPAHTLEGVYVVLVAHHVTGELRTRRRVFFNLPAAQRAADRATDRGHHAAVTLCRLAPLHTFTAGREAAL
ncbi:hypothetical protein NJC10_00280 [Micrococcus sp. M4NT]|uniref:hypothetical protein n=1 Tax=Micrococcus sp. M4NT TaxID=2957501 RepID=UPI0029AEF6DA|nr:hypothetical protein [Micrococcus sp. M4NT]MDX2340118.1 hypothetical protein [Micrococcus sp. M4NT]